MVAIITDGGVEARDKAQARAYMVTDTVTMKSRVVAEVIYRGRLFKSEVEINPLLGNYCAIQEALEDVRKKAKAVQLTDLDDMARIR